LELVLKPFKPDIGAEAFGVFGTGGKALLDRDEETSFEGAAGGVGNARLTDEELSMGSGSGLRGWPAGMAP
jgi:hypothetical protein